MNGNGKGKYVWVPKDQAYLIRTNPHGPKLKWVPKSSSSYFIDVSQGGGQRQLGWRDHKCMKNGIFK